MTQGVDSELSEVQRRSWGIDPDWGTVGNSLLLCILQARERRPMMRQGCAPGGPVVCSSLRADVLPARDGLAVLPHCYLHFAVSTCAVACMQETPMLNAPTDLHHRQPLLHDADRLIATAQTLLAHSRVLIARGKARAEARACAAVRYEVSLA